MKKHSIDNPSSKLEVVLKCPRIYSSCLVGIIYYYYYSHIFPDFRVQYCNYATLLAGRCLVGRFKYSLALHWYTCVIVLGISKLEMVTFP